MPGGRELFNQASQAVGANNLNCLTYEKHSSRIKPILVCIYLQTESLAERTFCSQLDMSTDVSILLKVFHKESVFHGGQTFEM